MKTGRNDPCPCGSGKKFKKCCQGSTSSTALQMSPVEISRLTAYKGLVGQQRQKWCEDFIRWKRAQLSKITDGQQQIEKATGKCISCSKGCWFCCSQYVGASLQECEAIVYWLYHHNDVRRGFLSRYSHWRSNVREHEDVFNEVNQAGNVSVSQPYNVAARDALMKKAKAYLQLDIPCPFLDEGSCSIYPVRPFVCASVVAVSPPENCKPFNDADPVLLLGAPSPDLFPPYFRGPHSVMFSPAPLLVYEILNGGFIYLNDLPGLNGMKEEAFSDPEVRAVIGAGYLGGKRVE